MDIEALSREFWVDKEAKIAEHQSGAIADLIVVTDDSSHQLSVAKIRNPEKFDGSESDFSNAAILAAKRANLI